MIAGRVTWTLPETIDIIIAKSLRNRGFFIVNLLNLGIVDELKVLILWAIRSLKTIEKREGQKYLFLSQDIHDVLKQCFRMIKAFLDGTYMTLGNLQNMLVPFRSEFTHEISGAKAIEIEQSMCATKLRNHLYRQLFLPCCKIFFEEHCDEILQFSIDYQRDMLQIISSIYSQLCGGFKFPLKSAGVIELINSLKNQQPKAKSITLTAAKNVNSFEVEMLVEMGFQTENAMKALELSNYSFDAALELLLKKKDLFETEVKDQEPDEQVIKRLDLQLEEYDLIQMEFQSNFETLMGIVQNSFATVIDKYLSKSNLSTQQQFVTNIFRLYRSEEKAKLDSQFSLVACVYSTIENIFTKILDENVQAPLPHWIQINFSLQMLKNLKENSQPLVFKNLNQLLKKLQQNAENINITCQQPQKKLLLQEEGLSKKQIDYANEMIIQEQLDKKQRDQQVLFNVNELLKLALIICNNVQLLQEAKILENLIKNEQTENTEGFNPDQLVQVQQLKDEENKKQNQLREKWQQILNHLKSSDQTKEDAQMSEQINTSQELLVSSLFKDEKEAGFMLSLLFSGLESLIRSFANIQHTYYSDQQDGVTCCCQKTFNILRVMGEIQQIGAFDFRKLFLASDLTKAIFEIKVVDDKWESKLSNWTFMEKSHYSILREVFEGIWCQPKDLQRIYETLIKRQMFYQFKQNFKRGESKELIDVLKTSILSQNVQSPQMMQPPKRLQQELEQNQLQSSQKKNRTKKHQAAKMMESKHSESKQKCGQHKRSQSEEKKFQKPKSQLNMIGNKPKQVWPLAQDQCSQKQIKKFIKKNENYNKQKFADFLGYYDSGAFGMNLKRIDIFIQSVAKLCILKTEIETADDTKNKNSVKAECKIMLKRNVLRDLLTDPDFHTLVLPSAPLNQVNRVQFEQELSAWKQVSIYGNNEQSFATRAQQDLVNQLLESLILQTKGYKMDLIKMFREPNMAQKLEKEKFKVNDTIVELQNMPDRKSSDPKNSSTKLSVCQESKSLKKIYLFDLFSIFNIFVGMLSLNIPIAETILRHNDRKTIKFLFRNIYFLFTMNVESNREIVFKPTSLSNSVSNARLTIMNNLFNHLLISNFGTRQTDIVVREEIQRVFISQIAKQINSINEVVGEGPEWANDAKLVNNFCPIWLLTQFITNKFSANEENAKDAVAAILQKKFKHMRLQRVQMVKLLILECQVQAKKSNQSSEFALLGNLQKITDAVVNHSQFFFNGSKLEFLNSCIVATSNVVKIFEASTSLFTKPLKKRRKVQRLISEHEDKKIENENQQDQALQLLEQGEYLFAQEEGEDEIEEMDDEEEAEMEEEKRSDESEEEKSSDNNSSQDDEDSYGSDFDDMHDFNNDLSSHRSNSRGSFDDEESNSENRRVMNLGDNDFDQSMSEYDEDYGSSEDSWEEGLDLIQMPADAPQVIVTTKHENNSPRGQREDSYGDYDEEDSSSNFVANSDFLRSEEEEENEEDEISLYDDEQDDEEPNQRTDTVHESFNSYADNEFSRATQQVHEHEDNWDGSQSDNQLSQSLESQRVENNGIGSFGFLDPQTFHMRDAPLNEQANPFAEAPLSIEVNMPQRMVMSQNGSNQIQKILEEQISREMEARQIDYFGAFGLQVSSSWAKVQDFKKNLRTNSQVYKLNLLHFFTFVTKEKPVQQEQKQTEINKAEAKEEPVSTFEEFTPQKQVQPKVRSTLEIEGMDPLFMENLTSVGLQNIADSHQIHNQISNQARGGQQSRVQSNRQINEQQTEHDPLSMLSSLITFLGSQTPERRLELLNSIQTSIQEELSPEMLAAARNLYQANGSDFTRIMNELRQRSQNGTLNISSNDLSGLQQLQQNQYQVDRRQQRPRLISMSSVSYDFRGDETLDQNQDQSMIQQQPPALQQEQRTIRFNLDGQNTVPQQQRQKLQVNQEGKNRIQLKGSLYMQNFFQVLQDQIQKFENDQTLDTVNTQCEAILSAYLVPQKIDTPETIYNKLKGPVQLALTAFKNFTESRSTDPQLNSSLVIISKIPYLRSCLNLHVTSMLNSEIKAMLDHRDKILLSNGNLKISAYKSQLTTVNDFNSNRPMSLQEVIIVAVNCMTLLQDIANAFQDQRVENKREIVLNLHHQPFLLEIAKFIGNIDLSKSILEGFLDSIMAYLNAVKQYPWLIQDKSIPLEGNEEFQDQIYKQLLEILKGFQRDYKHIKAKQNESLLPVTSICKLFLGFLNQDHKVSKSTIPTVRKALNCCCYNNESSELVSNYIKVLLDSLLKQSIEKLQSKNSENNEIQGSLRNEIEQISQLLKISGALTKINVEHLICSDQLLLEVFNAANSMLQTESQRAAQLQSIDVASIKRANQFMHRQDIKELVTLLFTLSEYSLKIIFSQKQEQIISSSTTKDNQVGDEEMVSTFQCCQQQGPDDDVISQTDETQKIIEILLEQHISKGSSNYYRFKTMISFFIFNKKLLNMFIRVNQQVINNELKNLVLQIPQILEFDTKRLIWRMELKKQHTKSRQKIYRVLVSRDRAFDDSFAHLQTLKPEEWKGKFDIQFEGEDGIDQGGLTKEWFMLLSKQMFDENLALFIKADNGSTYFPNPKSTVQSNFVELFNFVGKIIGKALWEQQLLDCYFVKAFYKMVLDMPLDLHDLEDYDQSLYKSMLWILENQNVENLSSYFVETMDYFGTSKEIELCEDGRNKLVTDENKKEYVRLVANFKLDKAISDQKNAFLTGFYSIVPKDLIKMFDNREIELLISGLQNIDIDDLKENTIYNGYNARSRPVLLLWEVLQELENSERAEFIQFVTGSSKVPIEGFKGLRGPDGLQKFTIQKIQTHGATRLPQSHTCVNTLDLPEYKDKETLKKMLLLAIREGKTFGIA